MIACHTPTALTCSLCTCIYNIQTFYVTQIRTEGLRRLRTDEEPSGASWNRPAVRPAQSSEVRGQEASVRLQKRSLLPPEEEPSQLIFRCASEQWGGGGGCLPPSFLQLHIQRGTWRMTPATKEGCKTPQEARHGKVA